MNVAEFICAILILIIHTNPFGSYSKALSFDFRNVVCVVAVPLFFATSGYLLMDKLSALRSQAEQKAYMKKYLMRLLQIYLIWSALYFPFVVTKGIRKGFSLALILEYIRDLFLKVAIPQFGFCLRKYSMLIFLCQRLPISLIELF